MGMHTMLLHPQALEPLEHYIIATSVDSFCMDADRKPKILQAAIGHNDIASFFISKSLWEKLNVQESGVYKDVPHWLQSVW
jgi:hypothetical protein